MHSFKMIRGKLKEEWRPQGIYSNSNQTWKKKQKKKKKTKKNKKQKNKKTMLKR